MLVKDGAAVVGRAVESLGRIPDAEVVLVDAGSSDDTADAAALACAGAGLRFRCVTLPDAAFFPDEQRSFRRSLPGPFTGLPLLRSFAAARNAGIAECSGRYVLKVDADDVCREPDKLLALLDFMEDHPEVAFVACPYEVMRPREEVREGEDPVDFVVGYTRLWRNAPDVVFREVCHEEVDYQNLRRREDRKYVNAADGPVFRDCRDSPERADRPPHAYFKTLLAELERCDDAGEEPARHLLLYLAEESLAPCPAISVEVLSRLDVRGRDQADVAWAVFTRGRVYDRLGYPEIASLEYGKAKVLGHARAGLYQAVLLGSETPVGRRRLEEAVLENRRLRRHYPTAASAGEISRALVPGARSLA